MKIESQNNVYTHMSCNCQNLYNITISDISHMIWHIFICFCKIAFLLISQLIAQFLWLSMSCATFIFYSMFLIRCEFPGVVLRFYQVCCRFWLACWQVLWYSVITASTIIVLITYTDMGLNIYIYYIYIPQKLEHRFGNLL